MIGRTIGAASILAILGLALRAPADAPIPDMPWLHEGLQVTSTWYAAVAPGTGSSFAEDEHGNWVISSTGQRYTRSSRQGTDASGISQTTIACIDGDRVVASSQGYAHATALGINAPVPLQNGLSFIVSATDAVDYWMSPKKLALLRSDPSHGVSVMALGWKIGDRIVDAIRVQNVGSASYTDHVYDRKTGGCIHFASSSRGNNIPKVVGPGDTAQGDLTLTQGDFVSMRDLNIPWARERMAADVAALKALHYRGTLTVRGTLPTPPSLITLDMKVTDRGEGWLLLASTSQMQLQGMPPLPATSAPFACGRAQFDGLWAGPTALALLHQGQVLDEDPPTQMRTVVAKVGADSILITRSSPGGEIASEYDKRSGLLVASSFINAIARQQTIVRLQGRD